MSDIPEALVEKAAQAIIDAYLACDYAQRHGLTQVSERGHEHAEAYARAALSVVLPDVPAAHPVVDRDALAKSAAESIMYHPAARTIPWDEREQLANLMGDSIAREAIASGVVADAADVRRAVAEERDRLAAVVARVRALCNGPAMHPQAPLYVRISAVLAILDEQGDIDLPEQARRLASQAWTEGYADGIHDWQKSLDHDGGQTPPARVNPYIAREAGEKP